MIGTAFNLCGTIVKFATSAPEALSNLDKWLPDLIIADISMPEMDGYELIRLIREREPSEGKNIPAIALTAMARIEDRIKALNAGFQMHVAKPVELSELLMVAAGLTNLVTKES
jgi:CheY-like chemotaxis protein